MKKCCGDIDFFHASKKTANGPMDKWPLRRNEACAVEVRRPTCPMSNHETAEVTGSVGRTMSLCFIDNIPHSTACSTTPRWWFSKSLATAITYDTAVIDREMEILFVLKVLAFFYICQCDS